MPRRKPNPYEQALLNASAIWSHKTFIAGIVKLDTDASFSRKLMEHMMLQPPEFPGQQRPMPRGLDGRPIPDLIEVDKLSDLLGTCEICGKLKAEINVTDAESGRAVSVCGDCYGNRQMAGVRKPEPDHPEDTPEGDLNV